MSIVKTARPLEIGDEILPWANTDEEFNKFEELTASATEELKSLPKGAKSITFLMKKEYRNNFKQNTRILYKKSIIKFNFKTGAPDYKDHWLTFNWGLIRTSNSEEIAYLDMHPKWFIREANRELTPAEKLAKENEELKAKLKALTEIEKQKEEIEAERENIIKSESAVEEVKEEVKINNNIEEKVRKRGRPRKS